MLDVLFWWLKFSPVARTPLNCSFDFKKIKKNFSCIFFFNFWSSKPWFLIGSGFTWNAGSRFVSEWIRIQNISQVLISLNWIGDKHNISESLNALPVMIVLMAKDKHFMYYVQEPEGITHPTHHLSRAWLPPSVEQRWAPNIHLLLFLLPFKSGRTSKSRTCSTGNFNWSW